MKTLYIITLVILMGATQVVVAQDNVIGKAIQNEISRAMDSLKLENMLPPSFISYNVSDAKAIHIKASLGAIISSELMPFRLFENRIQVGSKGKNNENFVDESQLWSWSRIRSDMPLTGGESDIRRALWLRTDKNYKDALSAYEAKLSAIRQQNLPEEEKNLPDFTMAPTSEKIIPYTPINIDSKSLENLARTLSGVFKTYPDIQRSEVNIFVFDGKIFYANSEGTHIQYPFQVTSIKVVANTQSLTGEVIDNHVLWFCSSPGKLPDIKQMTQETETMAKQLTSLSKAKTIDEPYWGPVMFEGQAAAELIVQKFFSDHNGLIAIRKPILGSPIVAQYDPDRAKENVLEERIGKRIISRDICIEALPNLKSYQGKELLGSFEIDAEGVVPEERIVLVENGVLKNLLNDRVPTKKVSGSNGHARPALSNGNITTAIAPGVIKVANTNNATSLDYKKAKEVLLAEAKDQDLEYAYIVRKIVSPAASIVREGTVSFFGRTSNKPDLTNTIEVYRVYVSDGREELTGLTEIKGLTVRSFNRLIGTSKEMQVYNTMIMPINKRLQSWNYRLTGIPASFIVPQIIIFQELEIVREKQNIIKNHPIVENPVKSK